MQSLHVNKIINAKKEFSFFNSYSKGQKSRDKSRKNEPKKGNIETVKKKLTRLFFSGTEKSFKNF